MQAGFVRCREVWQIRCCACARAYAAESPAGRRPSMAQSPARRMRLGPYHSQKPVMVNTSRASPITVV